MVAPLGEEVELRRRLARGGSAVPDHTEGTHVCADGGSWAPTSSLPEWIGSVRNWDYRFCWLRDATFTLLALLQAGYEDEAKAWRQWLLRAAAGEPGDLQIMYGPAGERRLTEWEVPWLPGYEGSRPVRMGNAASEQFQLDVYGEVIDALYQARQIGLPPRDASPRDLIFALLGFLEEVEAARRWHLGGARACQRFTHSKVMAWVAFDRVHRARPSGVWGRRRCAARRALEQHS